MGSCGLLNSTWICNTSSPRKTTRAFHLYICEIPSKILAYITVLIPWLLMLWRRDVHTSSLSLRWRHNGHDGVSHHQPRDCLLKCLFRCKSKKTSKLRVTGLCAGNSPVTGEFPAQRASNAENVSIWWRHHVLWVDYDNAQYYIYVLCSVLTSVANVSFFVKKPLI